MILYCHLTVLSFMIEYLNPLMEKYFPTTIAFTIFSDEHYHRVEVYEVESGF